MRSRIYAGKGQGPRIRPDQRCALSSSLSKRTECTETTAAPSRTKAAIPSQSYPSLSLLLTAIYECPGLQILVQAHRKHGRLFPLAFPSWCSLASLGSFGSFGGQAERRSMENPSNISSCPIAGRRQHGGFRTVYVVRRNASVNMLAATTYRHSYVCITRRRRQDARKEKDEEGSNSTSFRLPGLPKRPDRLRRHATSKGKESVCDRVRKKEAGKMLVEHD